MHADVSLHLKHINPEQMDYFLAQQFLCGKCNARDEVKLFPFLMLS